MTKWDGMPKVAVKIGVRQRPPIEPQPIRGVVSMDLLERALPPIGSQVSLQDQIGMVLLITSRCRELQLPLLEAITPFVVKPKTEIDQPPSISKEQMPAGPHKELWMSCSSKISR